MNDDVFRKFNADNSAADIAESHGWTEVGKTSSRVFYARPGGSGDNGANYMASKNVFFVHTTSADLSPGAYSAFDLFKHYECGGDMKEATRRVYKMYPEMSRDQPTDAPQIEYKREGIEFDWHDSEDEPIPFLTVVSEQQDRHFVPRPGILTLGAREGVGKTSLAKAICASGISGKVLAGIKTTLPPDKIILWFETEQARHTFTRNMKGIISMAGQSGNIDQFKAFYLSGLEPSQRWAEIQMRCAEHRGRVGAVVIDGIRDLMTDINDQKATTLIGTRLIQLRDETGACIIPIMHVNPSGPLKLQGSMGTWLMQKSDGLLYLARGEDTGIDITIGRARNWAWPKPWRMWIDEHFVPYSVDDPGRGWIDTAPF